jgi:hypothetical protein
MGGAEQEAEPPPLPVSRPPKAAASPPGSVSQVICDGGGWALIADSRLGVLAGGRACFFRDVWLFHNCGITVVLVPFVLMHQLGTLQALVVC